MGEDVGQGLAPTGLVSGGAVDALVLDAVVGQAERLKGHGAAHHRQVAPRLLPHLCRRGRIGRGSGQAARRTRGEGPVWLVSTSTREQGGREANLAAGHYCCDADVAVFAGPVVESECSAAVHILNGLADEGLRLLKHFLHLGLHREILHSRLGCLHLPIESGSGRSSAEQSTRESTTLSEMVAVTKVLWGIA